MKNFRKCPHNKIKISIRSKPSKSKMKDKITKKINSFFINFYDFNYVFILFLSRKLKNQSNIIIKSFLLEKIILIFKKNP